jgi:DNA-binding response OmpR family regulator
MAGGSPLVLVVEDDREIRDVVAQILELAGYRVDTAADGVAGLARIERGAVDLVVLDLMLPMLDGLELCRRIRSQRDGVYLPVIMLTALDEPSQRHTGFAAGADDYLSKPFDADDLLDRVNVWVHVRQRLQATHERLLAEQQRTRELAERVARDEAVMAMARTASDQLNQPLTVLLGLLELRQAQHGSVADTDVLLARLEKAADELAARTRALGHAVRYETRDIAGIRFIDLARAQELWPSPTDRVIEADAS